MSKGKRYTEEQILKVLQEIEAGASVASVDRAHGKSHQRLSRSGDNRGEGNQRDYDAAYSKPRPTPRKKTIVPQVADINKIKKKTE